MKHASILAGLTISLATGTGIAADSHAGHDHGAKPAAAAPAAAGQSMTEGEVRKIDKEQGKITLKHGEIRNIDMPPMTMVFRVQDPAMLDRVKEGDKVGFTADKIGGQFTVTGLEKK